MRAELAALLADRVDASEKDLLAAYQRIVELTAGLGEDADERTLVLAVIQDQATQMQTAQMRLRRLIAYARECSSPAVRLVDVAAASGISKSHVARYYTPDVLEEVHHRVGSSTPDVPRDPRQAVRQLLRRRRARGAPNPLK
ncbi:MAG: hypothetical protein WCG47_06535 [Dermatophilaceae bacterium]